MDRFQKQSIILMITNVESQRAALRHLVGMTGPSQPEQPVGKHPDLSDAFTTEAEDQEIDNAMQFEEDQREVLLQDLFKRSQQQDSLDPIETI
jgi:cell division protein FtsN